MSGRPRKYATSAERQAAYRARQREATPLSADLVDALPRLAAEFEQLVNSSLFPTAEQRELVTLLRRYLPDP